MTISKDHPVEDEAATRIYPGMSNYVDTDCAFSAAVEKGLADLDAGRSKTAAEIAAKFRRNYNPA